MKRVFAFCCVAVAILAAGPSDAQNLVANSGFEGGSYNTGWGSGCGVSGNSFLGNSWGWTNGGNMRAVLDSGVKYAGTYSQRTAHCTGSSIPGGTKSVITQNVNVGPNMPFSFTVYARHSNGNCPSIMCWNPEINQGDPEVAYASGSRYQWVTIDNWGEVNTWVSRSMSGTAPASGWITIMAGGAAHPGTSNANVYLDEISVVATGPTNTPTNTPTHTPTNTFTPTPTFTPTHTPTSSLPNVPVAPVVSERDSSTLSVAIGSGDGNGPTVLYAINISPAGPGGSWVQASGATGASEVWQTAASWGTVVVTGLSPNTSYTFKAKAKYPSGPETALGPGASASTHAWWLVGTSAYTTTAASMQDTQRIKFNSIVTDNAGNVYATANNGNNDVSAGGVTIFKTDASVINIPFNTINGGNCKGAVTKLVRGGDGKVYGLQNFMEIQWNFDSGVDNRVVRIDPDGTVTVIVNTGNNGQFNEPIYRICGLAFHRDDGNVYWTRYGNDNYGKNNFLWRYNVATGGLENKATLTPNNDGWSQIHRMFDLEYVGGNYFVVSHMGTSNWGADSIKFNENRTVGKSDNPGWGRDWLTAVAYDFLNRRLWTGGRGAGGSNIMTLWPGPGSGSSLFTGPGTGIATPTPFHANTYESGNGGNYWISALAVDPSDGKAWMGFTGESGYTRDIDRVKTRDAALTYGDRGVPETGAYVVALGFGNGAMYATVFNRTSGAFKVYRSTASPDYGPTFASIQAVPASQQRGSSVTITFTRSEALIANPTVTVNDNAATFVSLAGTTYTYTYTLSPYEPLGAAKIYITGEDTPRNFGTALNTSALTVTAAPAKVIRTRDSTTYATIQTALNDPSNQNNDIFEITSLYDLTTEEVTVDAAAPYSHKNNMTVRLASGVSAKTIKSIAILNRSFTLSGAPGGTLTISNSDSGGRGMNLRQAGTVTVSNVAFSGCPNGVYGDFDWTGTLDLSNATITGSGDYSIRAQSTGTLNLNTVVITHAGDETEAAIRNTDGVTMNLIGCTVQRQAGQPRGRLVYHTATGNVYVSGCTFTSQTANGTDVDVFHQGGGNLTIEDSALTMTHNASAGSECELLYYIHTGDGVTLRRSTFTAHNWRVYKRVGGSLSIIDRCLFRQITANEAGDMLVWNGSDDVVEVTNSIFDNQVGTSANIGVLLLYDTIMDLDYCTFLNCSRGVQGGTTGIPYDVKTSTITNSLFRNCTRWGNVENPGIVPGTLAGNYIHLDNSGVGVTYTTQNNVTTGATGVAAPSYEIGMSSTAVNSANPASTEVADYDEPSVRPFGSGRDKGAQEYKVADTPTPTSTFTPTQTPTRTSTPTNSPTDTPTRTSTPTNTPTHSPTHTPTDTPTNTPTHSPTNSPTNTPTSTPTQTPTRPYVDYNAASAAAGGQVDLIGAVRGYYRPRLLVSGSNTILWTHPHTPAPPLEFRVSQPTPIALREGMGGQFYCEWTGNPNDTDRIYNVFALTVVNAGNDEPVEPWVEFSSAAEIATMVRADNHDLSRAHQGLGTPVGGYVLLRFDPATTAIYALPSPAGYTTPLNDGPDGYDGDLTVRYVVKGAIDRIESIYGAAKSLVQTEDWIAY